MTIRAAILILAGLLADMPAKQEQAASSREVKIHGLAIRADNAQPVADAFLMVRTADDAVDFPQTWAALGDVTKIREASRYDYIQKRVREIGGWKPARTARTRADGTFDINVPRDSIFFVVDAEAEGLICNDGPRHSVDDPETKEGIIIIMQTAPSVAGRVLDPDGKPVAGAWVRRQYYPEWGVKYAQMLPLARCSDASGEYYFPVADGKLQIWAPNSNSRIPLVSAECEFENIIGKRQNVETRLQRGYPLKIKLECEDHSPAKNVDITNRPDGDNEIYPWVQSVSSDENGECVWPALPAGRYNFEARFENGRTPILSAPVQVPSAPGAPIPIFTIPAVVTRPSEERWRERTASCPSSKIIIHVRDAVTSRPVVKFDYLILNGPGMSMGLPETYDPNKDPNGVIDAEGPPMFLRRSEEHYWWCDIRAGGYQNARIRETVHENSQKEITVDLLRSCGVHGKVIDAATSRPVALAGVLYREIPYRSYGRGTDAAKTVGDGTFRLGGVGGMLQILIDAEGYCEAQSQVIELAPGESRDIGNIMMSQGGAIHGKVKSCDGKPVSGGCIYAEIASMKSGLFLPMYYARSASVDENGEFTIEHVFPGKWQIRAIPKQRSSIVGPPGFFDSKSNKEPEFNVANGQITNVELAMPASRPAAEEK